MVSSSASSGIRTDVQLPEDARMRLTVRRGAACAAVALTLSAVTFALTKHALALFEVDESSSFYSALGLGLMFVTAPLLILGALGLRAYPMNRHSVALLGWPIAYVCVNAFQRFVPAVPAYPLLSILGALANIALLLAADRILRDGAGDPTAPRSAMARVAIGLVVARFVLFLTPIVLIGNYLVATVISLAVVAAVLITFVKVRRALL